MSLCIFLVFLQGSCRIYAGIGAGYFSVLDHSVNYIAQEYTRFVVHALQLSHGNPFGVQADIPQHQVVQGKFRVGGEMGC